MPSVSALEIRRLWGGHLIEDGGPTPYTLFGAYTLPPTPCTMNPTPFTLQPPPYTLHPSPFTLHPTRGGHLIEDGGLLLGAREAIQDEPLLTRLLIGDYGQIRK